MADVWFAYDLSTMFNYTHIHFHRKYCSTLLFSFIIVIKLNSSLYIFVYLCAAIDATAFSILLRTLIEFP